VEDDTVLVEEVPFEIQMPNDMTRTPGLHLSDVIRDLALRSGILDAKWADGDQDMSMMFLGLAWEEWISKQHKEIIFHPGEIIRDGILMSPDGITMTRKGLRLNEFKYTRKSLRAFEESLRNGHKKVWMWVAQVMAYSYGLETLEAYLHVMFANGDYGRELGGGNPRYKVFSLSFSQLELKSNWDMILRHAGRMKDYDRGK
jgi:hypothetical protein